MTAFAAHMGDWAGAARFDLGGGRVELSFHGGEKVALDAGADEMDGFLSRWVAAVTGAKGGKSAQVCNTRRSGLLALFLTLAEQGSPEERMDRLLESMCQSLADFKDNPTKEGAEQALEGAGDAFRLMNDVLAGAQAQKVAEVKRFDLEAEKARRAVEIWDELEGLLRGLTSPQQELTSAEDEAVSPPGPGMSVADLEEGQPGSPMDVLASLTRSLRTLQRSAKRFVESRDQASPHAGSSYHAGSSGEDPFSGSLGTPFMDRLNRARTQSHLRRAASEELFQDKGIPENEESLIARFGELDNQPAAAIAGCKVAYRSLLWALSLLMLDNLALGRTGNELEWGGEPPPLLCKYFPQLVKRNMSKLLLRDADKREMSQSFFVSDMWRDLTTVDKRRHLDEFANALRREKLITGEQPNGGCREMRMAVVLRWMLAIDALLPWTIHQSSLAGGAGTSDPTPPPETWVFFGDSKAASAFARDLWEKVKGCDIVTFIEERELPGALVAKAQAPMRQAQEFLAEHPAEHASDKTALLCLMVMDQGREGESCKYTKKALDAWGGKPRRRKGKRITPRKGKVARAAHGVDLFSSDEEEDELYGPVRLHLAGPL